MKALSGNIVRLPGPWVGLRVGPRVGPRVGVHFEPSAVSLAVRRGRRIGAPVRRALPDPGGDSLSTRTADYRDALSALVAEEKAAGARCAASLPTARCRIQWLSPAGARLRDLRAAVHRPAFWQTHLGVEMDDHCVWWRFIRNAGERKVGALLAAAPREDVECCIGVVRAAGLVAGAVGVSCFDYFDARPAADAPRVTLTLDCGDACAVAAGAFGLRVRAAEFDRRDADALLRGDPQTRDGVVDKLAACVRRCVEDDLAAARLHADVRVVAARALHGDWLDSLKERLPGFAVEWVDGWAGAGLAPPGDEPHGESWQLPRAAACLARATRRRRRFAGGLRRALVPAVNFNVSAARGRRWLAPALFAAACVLGAVSVYAHWLLLAERESLQPESERHAQLSELRDHARTEMEALQSRLSHRVSFYSGIQRVSFGRKRMPRLLEMIELAALEGVWLNEIHFRQPAFLQITGTSLSDEQITGFIRRLRASGEVADVFLESATVEARRGAAAVPERRRLKDFVIACRLQTPGAVS